MKKTCIVILWLFLCGLAKAQDTDFWFTVPHLSEDFSNGYQLNIPAFFAISNGTNQSAHVEITRYNGGFPIVMTQSIAPGQLYKMDFLTQTDIKTIENPRNSAGSVTQFGIHITSDVPVSAYYMANAGPSRDIFTLKGKAALGTMFYVPMQSDNYSQTGSYIGAFDQIDIVATENNTTVTVVPKATVRIAPASTSPAGTPIVRTLNKGETLKIMENTINVGSLAGTSISASAPIAVTVTEDLVFGDTSGDQIVPVNSLGKHYVIAKGYMTDAARERVYMVATANGTSIKVNDVTQRSGMNAGDVFVYNITANVVYVEASAPIYCYQRTGFSEQGAALLPSMYSISQNQVTYFQVEAQYEKAFVVFKTGTESGFTISYNDATYPLNIGTPIDVPGVPEWKCGRFDLPAAANNQVVKISNLQSKFSFGYIAANATAAIMTSFGYLSQFGTLALPDTTYICEGSSAVLDAGYALSYDWTLPDGSHSTGATVTASETGTYTVVVDQDPFILTASTKVLHRFEGSGITSFPANNAGAGTYTYTANTGLYSDKNVSYTWLVDGVQVSTNPSYTATWTVNDEKLITLQLRDTEMNCSVTHTLIHYKLPDNIDEVDCYGAPVPQEWGMASNYANQNNLTPYQSVLVGDIDGDGIIEIIAAANASEGNVNIPGLGTINRPARQIAIYKGNNISLPPFVFNTKQVFTWDYRTKYGIVKTAIAGKDSTLIVVAEADRRMRAYNYNGQLIWETPVANPYHSTLYNAVSITFADLNHDGIPEIAISGNLYNSTDGSFICAIPAGALFIDDRESVTVQLVDVFNDGQLKYVMGNNIYDVNINAATNVIESLTLNKTINPPTNWTQDPDYVSLANLHGGRPLFVDIDHDGKLDLIVSHITSSYTILYVADPVSGNIKAAKYIPYANLSGYPFVGDVDGDGNLEITLIKGPAGSGAQNQILCYKYVPGNSVLQLFWSLPHTDTSAFTGLTIFDFDQDGIADIVYRDETTLRIIDGRATSPYPNRTKASVPNYSGTSAEYPVVADVDGDGQAEIIIVGGLNNTNTERTINGRLWIYKSRYPGTSPWAPARKVWNQYSYHPLYVNEDLSIPRYPMNPATFFPNGKQPFNNFLQQQTLLNTNGDPFFPMPNIIWDTEPTAAITDNSAVFSACIKNTGDAALQAPAYVTFYKNSIAAENIIALDSIQNNVAVDATRCFSFSIENIEDYAPFTSIWISVNDHKGTYPYQAQCALDGQREILLASCVTKTAEFTETICENQLPYTFRPDIVFPTGTKSDDYIFNRKTAVNNCDSIVTVKLTVNPFLRRSINAEICNGETYDFYGTTIDTAVSGREHRFSNVSGCDSIVTLNLTVRNVNYDVQDATVCNGESYDLRNSIINLQDTQVRFYLSPTDTGAGISPVVSPTVATAYYVKADNPAGCPLDKTIEITIAGKPTVGSIPAIPAICEGGSINLTAPTVTDGGAAIISQMWLLDGKEFNPNTIISYENHNQALKYIAENSCGTVSSNEITLFVIGQSDLDFTRYEVCLGNRVQLQAPESKSYLWLPIMSTLRNPTVSPTETTIYTLRLTNDLCTADYPVTVKVLPLPEKVMINQTGLHTVRIIADQPYIYRLNEEEPTAQTVFSSLPDGYHFLEITNADGCSIRQSFFVYGLKIPDFFTPNDDGINDVWEIENLTELSDAKVYIYDRLGKLLVVLDASRPAWDGKFNGKDMPSTDYWYLLEMPEFGERQTGHFTLKR